MVTRLGLFVWRPTSVTAPARSDDLSKSGFTLAMLMRLGIVTEGDVTQIEHLFLDLDKNHSGSAAARPPSAPLTCVRSAPCRQYRHVLQF